MGNILKNTVECTCEEFVAEIAGKRRKPYLDALKSTFKTIVLGKSTLVKEMSSFLRENEGRLERKRVQELMSGWLNAYDFAALLNPLALQLPLVLPQERGHFLHERRLPEDDCLERRLQRVEIRLPPLAGDLGDELLARAFDVVL